MPAVPSSIIEPVWARFAALLPAREAAHPLGCHRRRTPDRVVFDKLVQVLVFGCAQARIADASCSATTWRRRRDEWIAAQVIAALHAPALAACGPTAGISAKGAPAPVAAGQRWVVERTHDWTNAHKKLVWCTERRTAVVAFWVASSAVLVIVGHLVHEGWRRYRWDGRPARKP